MIEEHRAEVLRAYQAGRRVMHGSTDDLAGVVGQKD